VREDGAWMDGRDSFCRYKYPGLSVGSVPGTIRACVQGRLKNEHESSSLPWIEI
jgi:hypothetical protein